MKNIRDAADKKQRIMETAIKLISKKGYHGATTALIAKKAGVSQGLIFHYFKNKEGLFFSILEDASKKFQVEIKKNTHSECDILKKIENVALTYSEIVENHEELFIILLRQITGSGLDLRKEKLNKLTLTEPIKLFREILEEGVKQEVIRDIDLDVATSSFFGMLEFNVFRWLMTGKSFQIRGTIKNTMDIFIRGIRK